MAHKPPQIQKRTHTNVNMVGNQMVNIRCHPHPGARQRCIDHVLPQGMQFLQHTLSHRQCKQIFGIINFAVPMLPLGRLRHKRFTVEVNKLPAIPKKYSTDSSPHPITPPRTVTKTGDSREMCSLDKPDSILGSGQTRIGRGLGIPVASESPGL